ncbi:MAG: hypothetical protein UT34_C0001G0135 [candidate division WS6 bacterium GW2011_GWF2_39_15]|uniref:Uncharacterized protein n=1 Tax=candidate division WS6 bacterium GW2011_GWF2_39_15 TaxID=1619100 RepID=A0A0G0Q6S8_9BACT|nr:MAG: hypothetical protein UT34_C0001G0135 [candidate division WS6 bacterium GW2011_GWF2_39_15]
MSNEDIRQNASDFGGALCGFILAVILARMNSGHISVFMGILLAMGYASTLVERRWLVRAAQGLIYALMVMPLAFDQYLISALASLAFGLFNGAQLLGSLAAWQATQNEKF